jgi:fibronectin-binding autotransporter adhesin
MKTPVLKTAGDNSQLPLCRKTALAGAFAGIILAALLSAPAAFAASDYFSVLNPPGTGYDETGVTAGGLAWNASSELATPLAANVIGDLMVIGTNVNDFYGSNYTINLDEGGDLSGGGITIGATNTIITFVGTANTHFTAADTLTVAAGSTLIMDDTRDGGFNFNNEATTFAGGGTIQFEDMIGANLTTALTTENMTGAGTVILSETSTGSNPRDAGGFTLTAGTLVFATVFAGANAFNFTNVHPFSINGGSIDNTSGNPMVLAIGPIGYSIGGNFTFTGSSSLDFGTAVVTNTGNNTVTVLANNLAIGGVISGNSSGNSLTKLGAGTLQLYGANTYSGNTIVNAGALALTNAGSISSSAQIIIKNATFDISGLSVNYAGASPIAMTNSTFNLSNTLATAISTLSLTNSTLAIGELSNTTTNILTTTLNVGGTTNIINIVSLPLVTSYSTIFHILKATTVNGTLNFGLGTLPSASPPYVAYITNRAASGLVDLVLTGGPAPVRALVWTGTDTGDNGPTAWDVQTSMNWTNPGTAGYTTFDELDEVRFDDTSAGSPSPGLVNLEGSLTPGGLIVSNNVLPYTFTGFLLANGSGSLTLNKNGTGTLLLQEEDDSFSGGINVIHGTVIVDNNSGGINGGATIGAGGTLQLGNNDVNDVLPTGAIAVNGALVFNAADLPTTVANAIGGSGTVYQVNTNTVLLSDSGASSGNWSLVITNGTLQAADNSALGALPGGAVTITNGGTFDVGGNTTGNNANFGTKQFNIAGAGVGGTGVIINSAGVQQQDAFENITLTANATIGGPNRWDMRNGAPLLNLAGFTLTKTNANQNSLVSVHVTSGNIVIQQGNLSFEVTPLFDASAGTILVNSGGFVGQYKDTLGSFTRSIVLNGGGTTNLSGAGSVTFLDAPITLTANSTLGSFGGTEFFDGVISDGGNGFSLTTVGTGTNLLSATNTYSGVTTAQGTLGLTNHGSIYNSQLIIVTNSATFDISGLAIPFSSSNALWVGDDILGAGIFNLGPTLVTNFNYLSVSNAVINLTVINPAAPNITVTNLNLGDGGAADTINITALPVVVPVQFPLIKYANVTGTYSFSIGTYPAGYSVNLVNNTLNNSIDLQITGLPPGLWNGGGAPDNYWSDSLNWSGTSLTGDDALTFAGIAGLNNTNDTASETASAITFVPGAGAFTFNGNPVTLAGGVTNSSSNPQTIDLGLDFGSSLTNTVLVGGSSPANPLIIGGGLTNILGGTGDTWLTLEGYGVLTNLLNTTSPGGTNVIQLNNNSANWTLVDNSASSTLTLPWGFVVFGGTFNYGTAGHTTGPNIISTPASAQLGGVDTFIGDGTGLTGTFNMVNGSLTLNARLDTGTSTANSVGIVTQTGGILTVNGQFQGANIGGGVSTLSLSGGTFNIVGATTFVASRGTGSFTVGGTAVANLGLLDVSRGIGLPTVGVVNLNTGGKLVVSQISTATANATAPVTGATANFNFNGGLLQAGAASTNFITDSTAGIVIPLTVTVKSGGATINDGGFAISCLEALQHDSTLGGTPDGGLIKLGSGTLTLAAASTYTGNTVISNGTLAVNGSLGASAMTVTGNGTLTGNGTTGGNVTNNGTLTPGTTTTNGLLTCSANVLDSAASTNLMKLNLSAAPTNDALNVTGALAYGGTLNVSVLSGTPVLNDSFKLFTAASYSGNFAVTNLPALGGVLGWNWNPANGTLSVIQTVNTNAATANFEAALASGSLQFSWAPDHLGWQLYTNAVGLTATSSWFPVPGSAAVTNETIIINPANPNVFFQLRYP